VGTAECDVDAADVRLVIEMPVFYGNSLLALLVWRQFRDKEVRGLSKHLVLSDNEVSFMIMKKVGLRSP
jgi:hypothetical protein